MTDWFKRSVPFFTGFLFCAFGLNLAAQDPEFEGHSTAWSCSCRLVL